MKFSMAHLVLPSQSLPYVPVSAQKTVVPQLGPLSARLLGPQGAPGEGPGKEGTPSPWVMPPFKSDLTPDGGQAVPGP